MLLRDSRNDVSRRPTIERIIAEAENMLNALGKLEDRNCVRTVLVEPHVVKGGEAQHVGSSISTTVGRFVGPTAIAQKT